jgi:hypothetical protein
MVNSLIILPAVAVALTTSDSNSTKPLAAIATKWTRPHQAGVCFSRTGSRGIAHHVASMLQNPGAGMKPADIEPYDRIQKDGYMKVNCIKDAMFTNGDKFGPNKHEYKFGATANVSIVHYTAHVAKEDREKMTPEVCFNFCRTLDEMLFFGILNGRDCYCTPYFKQMASDSSQCDAVCEGDTSQTCGGKSKSNVWEMHMCNDDAQKLAEFSYKAHHLKNNMDELIPDALDAAKGKNKLGQTLQDAFGKAGDPSASNLMQKAKQAAGNLEHLADDAEAIRQKLADLISDADDLTGFNFVPFNKAMGKELGTVREAVTDFMSSSKIEKFLEFETAKKGDALLEAMEELFPKAQKIYEDLSELYLLSEPVVSSTLIMRSGNCHLDPETNCITPHLNDAGYYNPRENCHFEIIGGSANVEIKKMDTESYWDSLSFGGQSFSGDEGLGQTISGVTGHIYWNSDCCVVRTGFEACVNLPPSKENKGEGKQYYPIMYFVDKEYVNVPTTCSGDLIGSPIYYKQYDGCAAACDAENQECVGFAYFPTGDNKPNMCFLFSKFHEVQYYTGCDEDAVVTSKTSSFLQKHNHTQPVLEEPKMAVCSAKLSKFVGTNLTPDPSGKNKFKLKELTKADRCYKL